MGLFRRLQYALRSMHGLAKLVPILLTAVTMVFLLQTLEIHKEIRRLEAMTLKVVLQPEEGMLSEKVLEELRTQDGVLAISEVWQSSGTVKTDKKTIPTELIGIDAVYIQAQMEKDGMGWKLLSGEIYPIESAMPYGVINTFLQKAVFAERNEPLDRAIVLDDGTQIRIVGVLEDKADEPMIYLSPQTLKKIDDRSGGNVWVTVKGRDEAESFVKEASKYGVLAQIEETSEMEWNPFRNDLMQKSTVSTIALIAATITVIAMQELKRIRCDREMELTLRRLGLQLRLADSLLFLRLTVILVMGLTLGGIAFWML